DRERHPGERRDLLVAHPVRPAEAGELDERRHGGGRYQTPAGSPAPTSAVGGSATGRDRRKHAPRPSGPSSTESPPRKPATRCRHTARPRPVPVPAALVV